MVRKGIKTEDYTRAEKPIKRELERIYELARTCDVNRDEVNQAIDMLGYDDALLYTKFFVGNSLCGNLYLNGIQPIIEKRVSLKELRRIIDEKSELEITVNEIIQKFNFSKEQLNQRDYIKRNRETGTRYRVDLDPNRSSHGYEHLDSRLDRNSE